MVNQLGDLRAGRFELWYAPGVAAPMTTFGVAAEVIGSRRIVDEHDFLETLRAHVEPYPEDLRRLAWGRLVAEGFLLLRAAAAAATRGDRIQVVSGCRAVVFTLVLALHARARCFPLDERAALAKFPDLAGGHQVRHAFDVLCRELGREDLVPAVADFRGAVSEVLSQPLDP